MTDQHEESVAARFSGAARTYEQVAAVQEHAALALLGLLDPTPRPRSILDVGCGTGKLTVQLKEMFVEAVVIGIDPAPGMIAEARKRYGRRGVQWVVADLFSYGGKGFSLVTANSMLHWISPIERAFVRLCRLTAPCGRIAITVMLEGTLKELHGCRQKVAPQKAPPVRLPSASRVLAAAAGAGFLLEEARVMDLRSVHSSARDLLKDLHDAGVTAGAVTGRAPLLTRAELDRLVEEYESLFRCEEGVFATYRVLALRAMFPGGTCTGEN